MPVTLKEISNRANCSVMTVSNVLNNKGDLYRPEMRERVLKAARELGYRPNTSARATRNGRYGNITLLSSVRPEHSQLPMNMLGRIEEAVAERDLKLSFARLPDQKLTDPNYMFKLLSQWAADGLLINYTHGFPKQMLGLIREYRIPAIWMNCRMDHDCVYPDDIAAGRIATEHLIGAGYRQIAFVDYAEGWKELPTAHYSIRDRQQGYEQTMEEAGLEPRVIRGEWHVSSAHRLEAAMSWMKRPDRPEAMVVYAGVQGIELAAAMLGIHPGDVPIIAFGSKQIVSGAGSRDTVVIPQDVMGQVAVDALMQKIENPKKRLDPIHIQPMLSKAGSEPLPLRRGETDRASDAPSSGAPAA